LVKGCSKKNVKTGALAGSLNKVSGYRQIRANGKSYLTHRLAWFYTQGYFPENEIHHINHVRDDNRIDNLMEIGHHCNSQEKSHNTSGKSGVTFNKSKGMWDVQHTGQGGKQKYHGSYKAFEGACRVKDALIEADKRPHCVLDDIKSFN